MTLNLYTEFFSQNSIMGQKKDTRVKKNCTKNIAKNDLIKRAVHETFNFGTKIKRTSPFLFRLHSRLSIITIMESDSEQARFVGDTKNGLTETGSFADVEQIGGVMVAPVAYEEHDFPRATSTVSSTHKPDYQNDKPSSDQGIVSD